MKKARLEVAFSAQLRFYKHNTKLRFEVTVGVIFSENDNRGFLLLNSDIGGQHPTQPLANSTINIEYYF